MLVKILADDFVTVYQSPDPNNIYCYSPGIAKLPSGRLVVSIDLSGPGMEQLDGVKGNRGKRWKDSIWQGKVLTSDDGGMTWTHRIDFPFMHARPFVAGKSLYVLGHCNDLMIIRSDDGGITWSEPSQLTDGENWHQAPCNVLYTKGNVYLVMEKYCYNDVKGWPVSVIAPVLMRGKMNDDLTQSANWTFASELVFRDVILQKNLEYYGVPFYDTPEKEQFNVASGRGCAPMGWLESNVVQIVDKDHYWYDPQGRTFHLWMRAHTGGTGFAAIAKVVENEDETMTTQLETVPSGKQIVFVPCPGGQMKFHILYDRNSKLYWLLSTQATDSMTKAERLPEDRYGLPNNERQRLQLHFSKNCMDWCFAGLVAQGESAKQSRHYASMIIDGEDLHVVSRSADEHAFDAHQTNIISFHTIKHFRDLVY